jgi:hypothetical protein
MDPAPSDAITPGSAHEGLTDRPPPRPAVPPDPEAGRDLRLDLDRPTERHLAVVLALAVGHALLIAPTMMFAVDSRWPNPSFTILTPGPSVLAWLAKCIAWLFFFPVVVADAFSPEVELFHPSVYVLNSLLWAATVYCLILWRRTRLTHPSRIG